jgi:periplasmic divalent cation tolerance protein
MTELCEVVITAPDPDWLKAFSRKLIEQRLAASAHNFAPVQSIYRWHGEIYERTEGRVSLHTRRDRVAEIIALAQTGTSLRSAGHLDRTITGGNPTTWPGSPRRLHPANSRSNRPAELLQLSPQLQGRTFGTPSAGRMARTLAGDARSSSGGCVD